MCAGWGREKAGSGARPAADVIEDTLVERRFGPVPLEGKTADAVFQVLGISHESQLGRALSDALLRAHPPISA